MPEWMAAADALVHSTGGLTVLEALMRGCPPISYGWGRGHVRVNNRAFRRFGLAEVVEHRAELAPALDRALREGPDVDRRVRGPAVGRVVRARSRGCALSSLRSGRVRHGSGRPPRLWCRGAAAPSESRYVSRARAASR